MFMMLDLFFLFKQMLQINDLSHPLVERVYHILSTSDPEMFAEMLRWNEQVQAVASSVIGKSVVELDGNFYSCGIGECNLGNVLADAMVFSYIDESVDHEGWTKVSLAINTAGSIQSSLEKGNTTIILFLASHYC